MNESKLIAQLKNARYLQDKYGDEALLRLLAEECAECGQAALKLVRTMHKGETPVSRMAAEEALCVEVADVLNCIDVIRNTTLSGMESEQIDRERDRKMKRWLKRAKEGM